MYTSTAVTLRRVDLGKRLARVLNVGLGLMGWEGWAPRSLEHGEESESPEQPTLQACKHLPIPTQSQARRFREAAPLTRVSRAGLRLPSPRADLILHCRAAGGRLPSPAARQHPALQPGASVPPGRSKGPFSPNVPQQQQPVARRLPVGRPCVKHSLPLQHPARWVALNEQGRKSQAQKSHTALQASPNSQPGPCFEPLALKHPPPLLRKNWSSLGGLRASFISGCLYIFDVRWHASQQVKREARSGDLCPRMDDLLLPVPQPDPQQPLRLVRNAFFS